MQTAVVVRGGVDALGKYWAVAHFFMVTTATPEYQPKPHTFLELHASEVKEPSRSCHEETRIQIPINC